MALKRLASILLVLALAACGSMTGPRDQYWLKDGAPRFPSDAESLVAYHRYVWRLDTVEWARENERVRDAAARSPGPFQRLRQAVLAAAPAATPRDHARAQQMLEQYEHDTPNGDAALKAVVGMLREELAERRRLEERVREEARRAEDLDQKLGALKAIELNMLQRRKPAGRKP
ncbi:MAG TPA: hypothetical protein VF801_16830 [Rhodocyclaceae bacterium]